MSIFHVEGGGGVGGGVAPTPVYSLWKWSMMCISEMDYVTAFKFETWFKLNKD